MDGIIQAGRFIIYIKWLVLGVSGVFGLTVFRLRLKPLGNFNKVIWETLINSLLIVGFVWRFSVVLFEPVKVVNNPLSLMYYSGGTRGFLMGFAIAAAYLVFSSRKQNVPALIYVDLIISGLLAGIMLYSIIALFLIKQNLLYYGGRALLAVVLLAWQVKGSKFTGKLESLNQLLLWFSLGEIFISHFKGRNGYYDSLIWGFSSRQILFYALAVLSVGINLISRKKSSV